MTPLLIATATAALFLLASLVGGRLLRGAVPTLVHRPRLAVAGISVSLAVWFATLLALGPLLVWGLSGPAILPDSRAAEVCQRCLDAANPFAADAAVETSIPTVLLLGLPAAALLGPLVLSGVLARRRRRAAEQTCALVGRSARSAVLFGHSVTVVPDLEAYALALPKKRCGIVVSDGLLDRLDAEELRAVLEHEATHLRQRHHLILDLLESLTRPLRRVPFVAAVADTVPHCLEVAADNAARHSVSTPALAGALLKMGDRFEPEFAADGPRRGRRSTEGERHPAERALFAAGTERVRQLVAPGNAWEGMAPTVLMLTVLAALTVISAGALGGYAHAVMAGCFTSG